MAHVASLVLSHHEWWDCSGYPQGLAGEEIPYLSCIFSIIDAYEVMTNDQPCHRAMSKEKAVQQLQKRSGKQFDPELLEKFIEFIFRQEKDSGFSPEIGKEI